MRRAASRAVKLAAAAAAIFGVTVELLRGGSPAGALAMLSYYTLQSNIIVAAVCLAGAFARGRESPAMAAARGGATLWIAVTCIVYHFMLSARHHPAGIYLAANLALHYFTALAMAVDSAFLAERGLLRKRYAIYWLAYPAVYLAFAELKGAAGLGYPYWFLDPAAPFPKGAGSPAAVALISASLFAFFGLAGLAMALADGAAAGRRARRSSPR